MTLLQQLIVSNSIKLNTKSTMSYQPKAAEPAADTKSKEAGDYLPAGTEETKGSLGHGIFPTRKKPRDRRSGSNFISRVLFM